MPPGSDADEYATEEGDSPVSIAALQSTAPLENYSVVSERPVFNEDRRPAPVLDGDEEPDPADWADVDVGAPDVELAGIIITPTLRMATLKSPEHTRSLVAFEGQPLEGDFGTWQVSRIENRYVTLSSADGEEMQLELQVHDAMITEPPEVVRAEQRVRPGSSGRDGDEGEQDQSENAEANSDPMTRADEIRQRIEERREELRRAAEAADEGQAENYRDAIQNMINETRKDAEELAREEEKAKEQQAQDEG